MDLVRLASPWMLTGLLPVWALVLYAVLGPGRRREGAAVRAALACLTAGLLAAALAGPSVRVSREGVCPVVLAEDVSGSMSAAAGKTPHTETLAPWTAALPLGHVLLHPFADAVRTDVERGIEAAARALPDAQGILLLYTDARETRGDAVAAATRLAAAGIQVHAIMPDLHPRDVAIVSLSPMGDAVPGRPVRLRLRPSSRHGRRSYCRVHNAATGVDRRAIRR